MDRLHELPTWRVLLVFPAVLLVLGIVLVGVGVSGTSSGEYYSQVHSGKDPALLAGAPESIRSDEWNVGVPWVIGQVQQGLPARNHSFPGGMDPDIPFALPVRTASAIVEPQNLGFLFLDVGRGTAWKWWLPGLALIAAVYLFLVITLPRRPVASALVAVGFFFSPFFQWWYQTSTLWPVVWAFVALAAFTWCRRSTSSLSRWLWAVPVAYFTAVMAVAIYAPFIVPVVLVVVFFAIGSVVQLLRGGAGVGGTVQRLLPVVVGGLIGVGIGALWLESNAATVKAFLGTVYPGARLTPAGTASVISVIRTAGSSFAESLEHGGFLNINSSEASTFFFVGIFLVPISILAIVRGRRDGRPVDWTQVGLFAVLVLFFAFMFIPGWDAVAHLLFLDRTTDDRLRIGIGVASIALAAGALRSLEERERPPRTIAAIGPAVFLVSQTAIAVAVIVFSGADKIWVYASSWIAFAIISAVALYLLGRRWVIAGAAAFLIVSVASSIAVNPIYVGVLDLRSTQAAKVITSETSSTPGAWVGVGSPLVSALLVESGVTAYNGTQGAPSVTMWKNVDPGAKYESNWNRLADVQWVAGKGAPVVTNPAPNIIQVSFDACSAFAQRHVAHVLTDGAAIRSTCLVPEATVHLPHSTLRYYDVVGAASR